jgi:XTP/dITP diphosphohydrolase
VTQWIIATRSRGKVAELVPMLAAHGIAAIGLDVAGVPESDDEHGIEIFDSFEANARAKAQYFFARTGIPCLADDSGLCVDALDARPGVRSRRFAADAGVRVASPTDEDAANNAALIDACWDSGRAPPWRAHYLCAAAYVDATITCVATGRTGGAIIPDRVGDGGFGYDPFFLSDDLGVTFAQATTEEKARVSHRGRAFAALFAQLSDSHASYHSR